MGQILLCGGGGMNNAGQTGSSKLPVYINANGDAAPIDTSGITISITGSAAEATKIVGTSTTNQIYMAGFESPVSGSAQSLKYNSSVYMQGSVLYNAAWNDYAENRKSVINKPGFCVCEVGDGTLELSRERLQAGANIISDTYGVLIGPHAEDSVPIATAGRVLATIKDEISLADAGRAVCADTDGYLSLMTREEIKEWPDRIVGFISEIPTYEEWNGIKVNGRIWVKVK